MSNINRERQKLKNSLYNNKYGMSNFYIKILKNITNAFAEIKIIKIVLYCK